MEVEGWVCTRATLHRRHAGGCQRVRRVPRDCRRGAGDDRLGGAADQATAVKTVGRGASACARNVDNKKEASRGPPRRDSTKTRGHEPTGTPRVSGERQRRRLTGKRVERRPGGRALTPHPPHQPPDRRAASSGGRAHSAKRGRTSAGPPRRAAVQRRTPRAHVCLHACTDNLYTSGRNTRVTSTMPRASRAHFSRSCSLDPPPPRARVAEPTAVCAPAARSWPPAQAVGRPPATRGARVGRGAAGSGGGGSARDGVRGGGQAGRPAGTAHLPGGAPATRRSPWRRRPFAAATPAVGSTWQPSRRRRRRHPLVGGGGGGGGGGGDQQVRAACTPGARSRTPAVPWTRRVGGLGVAGVGGGGTPFRDAVRGVTRRQGRSGGCPGRIAGSGQAVGGGTTVPRATQPLIPTAVGRWLGRVAACGPLATEAASVVMGDQKRVDGVGGERVCIGVTNARAAAATGCPCINHERGGLSSTVCSLRVHRKSRSGRPPPDRARRPHSAECWVVQALR